MTPTRRPATQTRPWTVGQVRNVLLQAVILGVVLAGAVWLARNTIANLDARGIASGWGFLKRPGYFPISQSVAPYSPSDPIAWAFVVGLANTLFMSVLIVVLSTILGFVLALARRSSNVLASGLGAVVVDVLRNTPVIVQLLFWYSLVTVGLPDIHRALHPLPGVFLTDRGVYLPSISITGAPWATALVALALIVGSGLALSSLFAAEPGPRWRRRTAGLVIAGAAAVIWRAAGVTASPDLPHLERMNFTAGLQVSPEFAAMALGLVLYSSVYVGEIIRGGIEAVPKGQWEAARALGLSGAQTLRLVVLPQALRIIIPPLTSQYISTVKNTTLALVVGYPDISFVAAATISETGQAVECVLILMAVFLSISLAAAWAMNVLNRRFALQTR